MTFVPLTFFHSYIYIFRINVVCYLMVSCSSIIKYRKWIIFKKHTYMYERLWCHHYFLQILQPGKIHLFLSFLLFILLSANWGLIFSLWSHSYNSTLNKWTPIEANLENTYYFTIIEHFTVLLFKITSKSYLFFVVVVVNIKFYILSLSCTFLIFFLSLL